MKKILLFLIACATFGTMSAQLVNVTHEVAYTDDGTILGYPAGYTTWRIYADLQDPADYMSSCYAAGGDLLNIGTSGNVIWNTNWGGITGDAVNAGLFVPFPESQWDSFVTVGRASNADPGGAITAVSTIPFGDLEDSFDGIDAFTPEFDDNCALTDGAWFTPNGNANGVGIDQGGPGPYRVLLAQVTGTGDVEYTLNMQVFDEGDGVNGTLFYVGDCTTVNDDDLPANGGDDGDGITELDNDASCLGAQYPQVCACPILGCIDPIACNYDPLADTDDGSCVYGPANDACVNATAVGAGVTNVDNTGACYNEVTGVPLVACGDQGGWCAGDDAEDSGVWFTYTTDAIDNSTLDILMSDDGSGGFDTQVAVFDGCGGAFLGGNDDAGGFPYSLVSFGCGDIAPGTTIWILVDGWGGAQGSADMTITEDTGACSVIPGCMIDPLACNYDPAATVDDGSCCSDNCVTLTVGGGSYDGEILWDLYDSALNLVASGIAGTYDLCLLDDCYSFEMFDTFGDGWNGATYDFTDSVLGSIGSGDLDTASSGDGTSFGQEFINLNGACPVLGCTDPGACNYDPAATVDDGSCSNDNDAFACATVVAPSPIGGCGAVSGDLTGATLTAGLNWDFPPSGADRWYEFTAMSPGVSITVSTVDFDAQIMITDLAMVEVDEEDANFSVGDEVLNYGSLIEGNTYRVVVSSWGGIGAGLYDICIETLPDTRCDYGSGPYDLCDQFKADWVGADDYIFTFTGTDLTDYVHQSFAPYTFVQLFTVADLPWNDTYNVAINSVFNRVDGNGNPEVVVVDNNEPCSIDINPQPLAALRASDNCANYGPHFLGDYVAATPWICGASDWTWEFDRTDQPELPITHVRGAANRYMRLSDVTGLQPGGTYDVRVKPEFTNGSATVYGAIDCIQIVGIVPGTEGDGPVVVELENERVEDLTSGPEAALYPNPTTGEFVNLNLAGVESDIVTVDVYDMFGKLVQSEQITVAGGSVNAILKFNNEMASGVYMVNITMDGTIQTERLVIQK